MKVLVTGALGHVGSKLIRDLPNAFPRAEIWMIDNLSTQRYSSLFALPESARYHFIEGDVLNIDLASLLRNVDAVVHLAAITNATESFKNKDAVEHVNFNATRKVAEACVKTKRPLIHLSTSSVYGKANAPVDENCSEFDLQPQSPYAETKLREERMLKLMGEQKGLRYIICRFGTIFGVSPGIRFHTAVNKFCWQATLGLPVTVWKTALHQVRPYLDLADATRAIEFILKKGLYTNEIYNVVTLNATVQTILNAIKVHIPNLKVQLVDSEIMNQLSYHVLADKMAKVGFTPKGNLNKGIAETIELLHNANLQVHNPSAEVVSLAA